MSSAKQGLLPIFGGASVGSYFKEPKDVEALYKALKEGGCNQIDTAHIYGDSEKVLGDTGASTKHGFVVDSKAAGGFIRGSGTRAGVLQSVKETLSKLQVEKVNIFYLHAPDNTVDLSESLSGIQDAYKAGYFTYFGLSNYSAYGVQQVYDHCKTNNYVLPTHFQGNYNPFSRHVDTSLLPLLRKLNIKFYAYSPLAGGFLTKTKQQLQGDAENAGRFDKNHPFSRIYRTLYSDRTTLLDGLDLWEKTAQDANISKAELAYRWVAFDSALSHDHGDAIILGASRLSQVSSTLEWLKKGPLDPKTVAAIDAIWEKVKDEAPVNNADGLGLQ